MRREGGGSKRRTQEDQETHSHMVTMAGSYKEKLGEENPMSWRNLGQGQGEELRRARRSCDIEEDWRPECALVC